MPVHMRHLCNTIALSRGKVSLGFEKWCAGAATKACRVHIGNGPDMEVTSRRCGNGELRVELQVDYRLERTLTCKGNLQQKTLHSEGLFDFLADYNECLRHLLEVGELRGSYK